MFYMVFDVESIGLHGEGFAVGWVVVDEQGAEQEAQYAACCTDMAHGWGLAEQRQSAHNWLAGNLPKFTPTDLKPFAVRDRFWQAWRYWNAAGAILVADCAWPVEARFLAECVDDNPAREWQGPYPLHEVATARMLAGLDPLATVERLPNELPQHNPLADARQSARLWLEALAMLRGKVLDTAP